MHVAKGDNGCVSITNMHLEMILFHSVRNNNNCMIQGEINCHDKIEVCIPYSYNAIP